MPVEEFRETLEQGTISVLDEDDITIVQKRINLRSGQRHTMMSVDFMDDSFILPTDVTVRGYEFFVSPYPIIYTEMKLAETMPNRGPLGADDSVLFKRTVVQTGGSQSAGVYTAQMPNQFLGTMPTYSWYTPNLYLTLILHKDEGTPTWNIEDLGMSVYMAVKSENVNAIEYSMGIIREYDAAQGRNVMAQGRTIPRADNVGQTFPMWRAGGITPERMIKGGPSQADFFVQGALSESETMIANNQLAIWMQRSGQMQPYDVAPGSLDALKGEVPDWVRWTLRRMDLWFGNIRDNEVPKLKWGNGNGQMFDDAGVVS
jgi:hypothetical protein